MEPCFLTEYIKSPLFVKDLKRTKLFGRDYLLTDFNWDEKIENHFSFIHKPEISLVEEREEVIKNSESVLIILSEFTCSFIKDLCEKYTKKLTILDLYTGMGGKGRKIKGENFDDFHGVMEIYEPFDKKNLFDILKEISGGNIIRIPYQLFEEDIFKFDDMGFIERGNLKMVSSLSLLEYGYLGNQGTLLSTGGNFSLLLQVGDFLKEDNVYMDLFVFSKFSARNTGYILQSFERTKNIFFLLDDEVSEKIFGDLKQFCKKHSYQLHFILPEYQNITTIFDEYYVQQAKFEANDLCNRIEKLLEK